MGEGTKLKLQEMAEWEDEIFLIRRTICHWKFFCPCFYFFRTTGLIANDPYIIEPTNLNIQNLLQGGGLAYINKIERIN